MHFLAFCVDNRGGKREGREICTLSRQVWWSRAATVGLHAALGAALFPNP